MNQVEVMVVEGTLRYQEASRHLHILRRSFLLLLLQLRDKQLIYNLVLSVKMTSVRIPFKMSILTIAA